MAWCYTEVDFSQSYHASTGLLQCGWPVKGHQFPLKPASGSVSAALPSNYFTGVFISGCTITLSSIDFYGNNN